MRTGLTATAWPLAMPFDVPSPAPLLAMADGFVLNTVRFLLMIEPPGSGALPVVVSHYRIVQKLRSGGMADVYLAEDETLPRVVALKLLPPEHSEDDVLRHRFMREARTASMLSHSNIARIYEAGEHDGRVFIAMEYIEGESLQERIARGSLSIDEITSLALQLVGAVEDAHAHGVVHRDLKPSNVMLTPRGEVKVLDFGLAKFTDLEAAPGDATAWKSESGLVLGTVPYMSPEQALGRAAGARSDIFSIGVLLYELVTGRLPFPGATAADTLMRIVNAQPESMARFNYDLPSELERIIRRCLEKEPDRRYQTARDLLVELRNFDRDRAGAHPRRTTNRKRAILWASLVLVVAALVAVAMWKQSAAPAQPSVRSIAVLPFAQSGGQEAGIGDGIADLVISDLAQLQGLRVMARSTSFRYRNADSPIEVGDTLHVDAVLTGRVEARGNQLIVSTELVDAHDGSRIGGARLQRGRHEIATLAAAIGDEVARSLEVEQPLGARSGASADPVDAEAFRLYLRGRQQWNTRTPEGLRGALDCFRQTIEIDPGFAPAYAGLADTYSLLERYAQVPVAESRTRAIAAAERAVQLDPSLPEAHVSLGSVREAYEWDWIGAEREYRAAIRLSPSYATAHHWRAMLLARLGRFEEARQEIALARELDPLSPAIAAAAANIDYFMRDYARSVQNGRAALQLNKNLALARVQVALSLAMMGDTRSALRELDVVRHEPMAIAAQAIVRARNGDAASARGIVRLAESDPHAGANGFAIAAVCMAIGDHDDAFKWLNAAADARSSWVGYVAVDPRFDALRGDPRYAELLTKIGLAGHVQ